MAKIGIQRGEQVMTQAELWTKVAWALNSRPESLTVSECCDLVKGVDILRKALKQERKEAEVSLGKLLESFPAGLAGTALVQEFSELLDQADSFLKLQRKPLVRKIDRAGGEIPSK